MKSNIIDVSSWNGNVKWQQAADDGVEVAILRSTIGGAGLDIRFDDYATNAPKAGIQIGAYHLFKPGLIGNHQAEYFWNKIRSYKLWLEGVVDVEIYTDVAGDRMSKEAITESLYSFVSRYKQLSGNYPIIYTGSWFWTPYISTKYDDTFGKCLLWIAEHDDAPKIPHGWHNYLLWQYTDQGKINGMPGTVDLNRLP
jgi:lysozyme